MFGNNIKIHFAGAESKTCAAFKCAGINYALYSCYNYLATKTVDSNFTLPQNSDVKRLVRETKHVIQDSGIFTLMFGAKKDMQQTMETLRVWQEKMINFVTQNDLKCTVVEVDCQKILGPDEAWVLRKELRERLPNRQINTFHIEDGRRGLDRLIEFSDYIAISVPEFRRLKGAAHRYAVARLVDYIKNKKPEIDIHLLGCTDKKILEENRHCTSADSTAWLAGVKYGYLNKFGQRAHISQLDKGLSALRSEQCAEYLSKQGKTTTEGRMKSIVNDSLLLSLHKKLYEQICGSQE